MKVAITTLGCKVNQYEGTKIINELSAYSGIDVVPFEKFADIYFINSCAVTSMAGQKSRKYITRARKKNPSSSIIVLGCSGELEPDNLRKAGADLVIKNSEKNGVIKILNDFGVVDLGEPKKKILFNTRKREIIKVQDGCDQFCSYCVIPYLRGRPTSSLPDNIVDEVVQAEARGIKEVVITGIHLGKYGSDLDNDINLKALLVSILRGSIVERIRLSSIEPFEIDDELLRLVATTPRIADHLHIPLQSGSDKILKAMNRPYTRAQFKNIVSRTMDMSAEIAITTDVMVGFPGETEDDIEDTISLVRSIGFSRLHIFQYSDRPQTKSLEFTDKVSAEVKRERAKILMDIGKEISTKKMVSQIGKTLSVAVTGRVDDARFKGKSSNYMDVIIRSNKDIGNAIVQAKITNFSGETLIGELR